MLKHTASGVIVLVVLVILGTVAPKTIIAPLIPQTNPGKYGGVDGGSRCRMLIIRNGNVALLNLRNTPVALSS